MKKINAFLIIVLTLLLAFAAYFFIGGTLQSATAVSVTPASEQAETFASIQNMLASGTAPQVFSEAVPQSAEDCALVDVTIALANPGLFDAEWLDISVAGASGDIAVYSITGNATDVPARSTSQINLKLITTRPDAARTVTLQYYVFGMSRSISVEI